MERGGGAWTQWQMRMMLNYEGTLRKYLRMLERIPRVNSIINDNDVRKLITVATALRVDLGDLDLRNVDDFDRAKGMCGAKIIDFLHHEVRPRDPYTEFIYSEDEEADETEEGLE